MGYAMTSDFSKTIVALQKEAFTKNYIDFPAEYPEVTTEMALMLLSIWRRQTKRASWRESILARLHF